MKAIEPEDGLALIERSQRRIRALTEIYADPPRAPSTAHDGMARSDLLIDLHIEVVLDQELALPILASIAEVLDDLDVRPVFRDHKVLKANLLAFALSVACDDHLVGEAWQQVVRSVRARADSFQRCFLPVADRWLDDEARRTLAHLWSARRRQLRCEFETQLDS